MDAGQVELHPFGIDEPRTTGVLGVLRPLTNLVERGENRLRGNQCHPFVVELVGDQLPTAVLLSDPVTDRNPHVGVIGRAGAGAGHRVHRRPGEALGVGGHDQHRYAAVLLGLGVGAYREPDEVGVLDQAGPHLLAVDHVLVAVADGGGAQRREIGARTRLGVTDREVDVARGDLGQVELLLLLGAERHDGRCDAVDRQERDRGAGDGRFVGEDELVHGGSGLAAVFHRPAQGQPAVAAHLRHRVAVDVPAAVFAAGGHQGLAALRGDQAGEVSAQLALQLLLLGCVADPHAIRPPRSMVGGDPPPPLVVTRSSLSFQRRQTSGRQVRSYRGVATGPARHGAGTKRR